ncbi:DNA gyrase inhibitor YacG [Qingshengfaniella alkalisoli]|uniref:DNA gyrase inhibitor YacG n=1 Tax=Qingshengfaniella alkalisoli TaxID=2599296 RepID=A0A5B8I6X2_9RHOB|nr:DNA gyrase inhibitor YacG [Qingshengfaniella alkalisoli]QDY68246.1 DNA gyrase inhibitor YacG [Qingshengfaniella alkalisoli]
MTCPICSKPTDKSYRPFCSKRCADADLGNWIKGNYSIPSSNLEDMPESSSKDAPRFPQRH